MIPAEVLKKIRQIEISTRRLLSSTMVGDSRSAIKGTGFEFNQIREYQVGDDIRHIDWNSSARMNKLLVKECIEERNRTIILAVDVSGSSFFSSSDLLRYDVSAQIASVLALVADYGKDLVGLLLFSDTVELYIPPRKGRQHVRMIMNKLFSWNMKKKKTSLSCALAHLVKLHQRNAIVFMISDFIDTFDTRLQTLCKTVAKKYDFVAVRCLDEREYALPSVGFLPVQDTETGQEYIIDTRVRGEKKLRSFLHDRALEQKMFHNKFGVEVLDIAIEKPFVGDLIRFFVRRMRY